MKNIRMLLVGLIAGVILATSATAFAGPALERIAATLRPDYKVKVDGAAVELKYSPIVYNGSTYIPLREAGDILGYNVSFESSTITLNSKKDVDQVSTTTTEWINARDLMNLLGKKYPQYADNISALNFVPKTNVLTIGDQTFTLLRNDTLVSPLPLIEAGIITDADLQ